ncbi:Dimer-Tnp-hAT domain containing protein [Pyrenophora tritici-repentis]|nr:Dimer-Tnp-hAT domain containing protein [Pyrenophora tritici-repentis]
MHLIAEDLESNHTQDYSIRPGHVNACLATLYRLEADINEFGLGNKKTLTLRKKMQKLTWPSKVVNLKQVTNEIREHRNNLNFVLSADSMTALLKRLATQDVLLQEIHDVEAKLREKADIETRMAIDEERQRTLDSFPFVNPQGIFQANSKLRHSNTGFWLIENDTFTSWIHQATQQRAVAFFYCDYKDKKSQKLVSILGTITSQLARQNEQSFQLLQAYASTLKPQNQLPRSPEVDELVELIKEMAKTFEDANASPPIPTFELQFLESQAEAEIVAPTEGSRAGTVATTEAGEGGQDETNSALVENFDGIDWARLPDFIKPLARSKRPKVGSFSMATALLSAMLHLESGYNLSSHPSQPTKAWPQPYERWPKVSAESSRPAVVAASFDAGLDVQQNTANAFGNFDVEGFRTATVMWLVNRNHPLSELTTPDFREMMRFANPEAEAALWYNTEEQYMREWRKDGPIGVLVDVINYIKTPQQYELFRGYQRLASNNLPAEGRLKVLEPVKPVVTRWNSYYAAFERATKLQAAYNLYAEHHINRVILEDAHAAQRNNKRPDAPNWMRSTGLRAADWAVIAEYQDCLEPLNKLEARARPFEHVDFNAHAEAPEDHLNVNLRAAWGKANDYYNKLDDSPAYYAACQRVVPTALGGIQTSTSTPAVYNCAGSSNIDEAIIAILSRNNDREAPLDEFERWKTQEPQWTQEQYNADGNPVQYWIQLLPKYPHLAQFAIDIMTIPASSSDCERLFSELGDLLEPKRRALGSELLAALQLVRSWVRAGYKPYNCSEAKLSDEQLVGDYNILEWNTEFW